MSLGRGTVEWLQWAYDPHLPDNAPHRHTFFEVCLVGSYGRGRFIVQGHEHLIGPGSILVARPGVIHQILNTDAQGMELFWTCFQWTPDASGPTGDVDRLLQAFAASPIVAAADATGGLASQWQALRQVADAPAGLGRRQQQEALAAALLIGIAQMGSETGLLPPGEAPDSDTEDHTAQLAVRFIHDNLSRPLPLAEIAAQACVSARHLARLFRRLTGESAARYIAHARMDRARGLLTHTGMPIKEVAAAVGYPDVHHFTRAFSAHFGCPPGEFRRRPEMHPGPIIQNPGDLV